MDIQTAVKIVAESHRNFISATSDVQEAVAEARTHTVAELSTWPTLDAPELARLRDAYLLVVRTAQTNPALLTAWVKQLTPVSA